MWAPKQIRAEERTAWAPKSGLKKQLWAQKQISAEETIMGTETDQGCRNTVMGTETDQA